MSQTVLVSGASGFVAQHLVKLLLESKYKVIGTVRSEAKGEHLVKLFKSDNFSYEIVADIVTPGAFDNALKNHPEISVFFHTASPFHAGENDIENELIRPAVEGTKNALSSAKAYGKNLKSFVLTASLVNVVFSFLFHARQPERIVTEETWTDITLEQSKAFGFAGYVGSKTLGEQAAWKFIEEEKPDFAFATINPPYIFGPQAFDSEVKENLNTSAEVINSFLKLKESDPTPEVVAAFYDVRDVARAHIAAAENKEANGKRILTVGDRFNGDTLATVVNKNFPELKGKVPAGDSAKATEVSLAIDGKLDDSKSKKILGFEPISFEKSVVDSIKQILAAKN